MKSTIESEICVLGGGPAGSVTARRLAELGHNVVLIERAVGDRPPQSESLAPSIIPILESLQLHGEVEAAVFHRERHSLVLWEPGDVQTKSFDASPSRLVERTLLDDRLRGAAARAGVRLIAPARGRAAERRPGGGWLIPVAAPQGPLVVKTKFLVDARGRRHSLAGDDGTPQTVALSAQWALVDQAWAQTRIEAGSDEWLWGSPLPAHRYGVTIFLDPSRVAGLHKDVRAELYRRILSRSQLMKCLLQGRMIGPVTVRDATPHTGIEPIGSDFIRVGEASISIDPLSSQGIQTVLVSAIQGTAAVHTILTAGCDPIPPFEFYRNRQLAAAVSHRVMSARLYQASRRQTPFWKHRARMTHHPQAADQLQRKVSKMPSQVSVAQSLRVVEVPVLCGAFIRRIPALCHPRLGEPVAYFAGLPLAPLVREACGASSTDEILQRWTRRISAEAARSIIAWMWSVGILIAQVDP